MGRNGAILGCSPGLAKKGRLPMLEKIVSGGQTGVDRGALDAALAAGFACGGWCPPGRKAEDGRIADRYPLHEVSQGSDQERTVRNVQDSDGTLIIYRDRLTGGTLLTVSFCTREGKPMKLLDAGEVSVGRAAELVLAFVEQESIGVLNVAGPRESGWRGAADYTVAVMGRVLQQVNTGNISTG